VRRKLPSEPRAIHKRGYAKLIGSLTKLLEEARRVSARSINAVMTATYWEIGRRIVEFGQKGKKCADYGVALLKRLSSDLTDGFGRGFSERNLALEFYQLGY
jgi:NADH/NAD ratio-sensing transcriptional regulator Rex